jgi:hypothetical protein
MGAPGAKPVKLPATDLAPIVAKLKKLEADIHQSYLSIKHSYGALSGIIDGVGESAESAVAMLLAVQKTNPEATVLKDLADIGNGAAAGQLAKINERCKAAVGVLAALGKLMNGRAVFSKTISAVAQDLKAAKAKPDLKANKAALAAIDALIKLLGEVDKTENCIVDVKQYVALLAKLKSSESSDILAICEGINDDCGALDDFHKKNVRRNDDKQHKLHAELFRKIEKSWASLIEQQKKAA